MHSQSGNSRRPSLYLSPPVTTWSAEFEDCPSRKARQIFLSLLSFVSTFFFHAESISRPKTESRFRILRDSAFAVRLSDKTLGRIGRDDTAVVAAFLRLRIPR